MKEVTIRRVTPADKPVWLDLRKALWPACSIDKHGREMTKWLAEPERYPVWVAETGEGLCGFIEVSLKTRTPGCMASPVGFIEGWYVAPAYRDRGIGKALVRAGEEWAAALGALEMGSDTDTVNQESRAAHGRLGYREVCAGDGSVWFIKDLVELDSVFGGPERGVTYRTRWGAYAIIENDRGMIAAIRIPRGLYLPGGGMEGGEDYAACLNREALEEMGCRIRIDEFIGRAAYYGHSQRIGGPLHTIACFYRAGITDRAGEGIEPNHEPIWLPPEEAARGLYLPHQRWAVAKAYEF